MSRGRHVIVTPYFKEERAFLERCIASVRQQTIPTDHFLVSDGFPQDWIDDAPVRHIKLDRNYRDYGNTPRSIGALLAVSERYDGIGFLDADNWLEPDHVERCARACEFVDDLDYVIAQRNLRRPDGTIFEIEDEPTSRHVDTNCFFLLPGSYHVIPHFMLMPQELAPLCDRIFYRALRQQNLKSAIVKRKTVNYHCNWRWAYDAAGETAPPDAKPNLSGREILNWYAARTARQRQIIDRLCGAPVQLTGATKAQPGDSGRDPSSQGEAAG